MKPSWRSTPSKWGGNTVKVYDITIKPLSGFGTPLKGDTLFGHFCWQVAYDEQLLGAKLKDILDDYDRNPCIIFSSAFPKFFTGSKYQYALPAPALPPDNLFVLPDNKCDRIRKRKEFKAQRWMMLNEQQQFSSFRELNFSTDAQLFIRAQSIAGESANRFMRRSGTAYFSAVFSQSHNTINRLTGTTGEGRFAPFSSDQQVFHPETELALFVGFDETKLTIDQIRTGLERIGDTGFGRDASTGLGRFQLGEETLVSLSNWGSSTPNACYTLAPCVPEKNSYSQIYFVPFTRFGRHGDVLACSGKPFKNPVIMADEGAVLFPKDSEQFKKPYVGTALGSLSKAEPATVAQGFSLYLPVSVEV